MSASPRTSLLFSAQTVGARIYRYPYPTFVYGPIQRTADAREARRAAAAAQTDGPCRPQESELVRRLVATYRGSSENAFAQVRAACDSRIGRLNAAADRMGEIAEALADIECALADESNPDPAFFEWQREAAVVALRRAREECDEHAQVIALQYARLQAADASLRAHMERRAENYGRWWLRATKSTLVDDASAPRVQDAAGVTIEEPWWAHGPCPWIPEEFRP